MARKEEKEEGRRMQHRPLLYFAAVELEGSLELDRVAFKFVCLLERHITRLNIADPDWRSRISAGIEYVEWNRAHGFMATHPRVVHHADSH
jgi:hypothetical protein